MAILTFRGAGGVTVEVDTFESKLARMRYRLTSWARAVNDLINTGRKVRIVGLMLTYRPGESWGPRDISQFLNKIRDHAREKLLAYAWVAEVQQRGAVHYHVCLVLDAKYFMRMPDRPFEGEAAWWSHGLSNLRVLQHASSKYLMKYGEKREQKEGLPSGARMFSVVIRFDMPDQNRFFFKLSAGVGYVRRFVLDKMKQLGAAFTFDGWKWEALPFGGWIVRFRKMYWVVESQFKLVRIGTYALSTIHGATFAPHYSDDL